MSTSPTSADDARPSGDDVVVLDEVARWWAADVGLRPVSVRIAAGELLVVRGRSGSGKSTLLAVLAGWTPPDSGALVWGSALSGVRHSWAGVAVVPQVLGLVHELTVVENVMIALGRSEQHPDRRGASTLAMLDLTDLAHRFPDEISLGQQQRTAVARAVVAEPVLLLADEPTSHQDPAHVDGVLTALRRVAARGTAVVVATHERTVVEAATRVLDLSA
jgi:ABC-type lipoprotein export system ATPase subunit